MKRNIIILNCMVSCSSKDLNFIFDKREMEMYRVQNHEINNEHITINNCNG